jgi:hypothetical protein
MPKIITKSLYNGAVKLNFYPSSHRYKVEGEKEWLTSVTSVTGLVGFPKEIAMKWAIGLADTHLKEYLNDREGLIDKSELQNVIAEALSLYTVRRAEAADVGTLIHSYAEAFARAKMEGTPPPLIGDDLPEQVLNGINGFLDWYNAHNVKFLDVERLVYSRSMNYAGLFDALIEIDGKQMLTDWKSSNAVYPEMNFQLAAYRSAYEEEMSAVNGSLIIRFGKDDGSFEVKDISDSYFFDVMAFQGLLKVKNRLKELNRVCPKL